MVTLSLCSTGWRLIWRAVGNETSSLAFFIVLAVRILRVLSERNTLTTVLGSVYLKSEFKTSLYRSLQPLLFVFIFLVKDQEVGNTIYQKELQVFKAMALRWQRIEEGFSSTFYYSASFCMLLCSLISLYLGFLPVNGSEDSC